MQRMVTEIRIDLKSTANSREHHHARANRIKEHRRLASERVANARIHEDGAFLLRPPWIVIINRFGARLLDTDNLENAAKSLRDGIADALGYDDARNDVYRWHYGQAKSKKKFVRIEIYAAEELPEFSNLAKIENINITHRSGDEVNLHI